MAPDFTNVPPKSDFEAGQRNPAFTQMGRRFKRWLGPEISHDGDGYDEGPVFSTFDKENVELCQRLMGKKPTGVFSQAQWSALMTTMPVREYRVTAQSLNVRASPKITADVVRHLHLDDVVKVIDRSRDKYWLKVTFRGGEGWSSHKFLAKVPIVGPPGGGGTPWLPLARAELGTKERVGSADNPRIVQYLSSTSLPASLAGDDATHWCSAFVNFIMERAGFEGTDSAMARSWLNWGRSVARPTPGCIVVFERPEGGPTAGHVAFFISGDASSVSVLGGNQGDAVTIAREPRSRVLGFRLPG